ncbi:MAG: hypothetical protein IT378_14280 [Sandaracinaceae bacterium]|nr:hypothetical protein [Sandaracinaceae bacterium]
MRASAIPILVASLSAFAQPPADGAYEAWSSLRMTAVGPLAGSPPDLPEWIEVRTAQGVTSVTFIPDRRVVWRITWGPQGPTEKRVEVDGELFARARYDYDTQGRLTRKTVEGPAAPDGPRVYDYVLDAQGRPIERRLNGTAPRVWGSRNLPPTPQVEVQSIVYRAGGTTVRSSIGGREVRLDEYDLHGRLLRTRWGPSDAPSASHELRYVRRSDGSLDRIDRRLAGGRPSRAAPSRRDRSITPETFGPLSGVPIERREARMLLGAPASIHDELRGAARRSTDDWSDGCWLNQPSAIEWDATNFAVNTTSPCICGFCVDAALRVEVEDAQVLGVDLHYTAGPWVRLDGAIDVTADHRVITPRGPVPAGELRPGDSVLASDGTVRELRSVEPLLEPGERLGRNVRTRAGVFGAAGLLFESEPLTRCLRP